MDPIESRADQWSDNEDRILVDQDDPRTFVQSGATSSTSPGFSSLTIHASSTSAAGGETALPTLPSVVPSGQAAEMSVSPLGTDSEPAADSSETTVGLRGGLIRLARPHQWIKNILVFVAPAAGGVLLHWSILWHATAAFGIFCLAASGTYFLNDAMDKQADRMHPVKRFRPVACGAVPVALALVIGSTLLAISIVLAGVLAGYDMAIVMMLYAAANIGYSLGLKNEPILDLALVCAGFVLRAVAGGVATGVPLSNWFIIVASFGSLLVVTGKRSGEKQILDEVRVDHSAVRQTLGLYTPEFLRAVLTLSAGVTVTGYCLWAFERSSTLHGGHDPVWFQLSIIPFVIAVLHLVRQLDSGKGSAPEDLAIHDHRLQIYGLIWIAFFAVATYA